MVPLGHVFPSSGRLIFMLLVLVHHQYVLAEEPSPPLTTVQDDKPLRKRINFVSTTGKQRTPNPPGWEEYDGSIYTQERGYGWLTDLTGCCWDRGGEGEMILPNGTKASPRALGRLELANWQGTHQENLPIVFRIDLPNGWYRVTCTSVHPGNTPLPLVDLRSIKFRAHNVVFAGPAYGAPLKIAGNRLVEGSGVVEVTEGHLRIVVGDAAYAGWTWSYQGPWYRGWRAWFGKRAYHNYTNSWYQKLNRVVDPGFHSLRFNSLEVERVPSPAERSSVFFRDFFTRDDSPDLNAGIAETDRWVNMKLHTHPDPLSIELYKTSVKLTGPRQGKGGIGLIQHRPSPQTGVVRYSTRVSLFTGEGSQVNSGIQEAGLLFLGEPTGTTELNSTFLGVAYDRSRMETPGWVRYRVGNGRDSYRTETELPDTVLPFKITEGEYAITVEHDVADNVLRRIVINGVDLTDQWSLPDRKQRLSHGLFGVRALMDAHSSGVRLQQFYWYYCVEVDG